VDLDGAGRREDTDFGADDAIGGGKQAKSWVEFVLYGPGSTAGRGQGDCEDGQGGGRFEHAIL
jgi:hypothetical protein